MRSLSASEWKQQSRSATEISQRPHQTKKDKSRFLYKIKIESYETLGLLDSGAMATVITESVARNINTPITPVRNIRVMSASGHSMGVVGTTYCNITSGRFKTKIRAVVVKNEHMESECILGNDFWTSLPVYKEVMQKINEELEAVNDEFPNLVKQARRLIDELRLKEDLYPLEIATNEPTQTRDEMVDEFIAKNEDVFLKEGEPLGCTSVVEHEIKLIENAVPKRAKTRRFSKEIEAVIEKQLTEKRRQGIIRDSKSEWAHAIVMTEKKDDDGTKDWRLCIDFKEFINALTVKDRYPLPNLDIAISSFHGVAFLSTFDVSQGFHQIPMAKDSIKYTAFTSHMGLFEFVRMPFGLSNAPSTFQRFMDKTLEGLIEKICRIYVDDVVVFTPWIGSERKTIKLHLHHCSIVLARFRVVAMKLKKKKMRLLQDRVNYLGFTLTRDGIKANESKVEAIMHYKQPSTIRQIRGFLGFLSFYRRFIRGFAEIADPLYKATQDEKQLVWTPDCQRAFDALRLTVTREAVLAYPNSAKTFILETDASDYGVGAVLEQEDQNALLRPVCFYSKHLSKSQMNYATIQKECLALVLAVRFFRIYLYSRPFIAYTDHQPLVWFINRTPKSAIVHRWFNELTEYEFELKYKKGDGLSRIPLEDRALEDSEETPLWVNVIWTEVAKGTQQLLDEHEERERWAEMAPLRIHALMLTPDRAPEDYRNEQLRDRALAKMINLIEKNERPGPDEEDEDVKAATYQWKKRTMIDGVLYRKFTHEDETVNQYVVPKHD